MPPGIVCPDCQEPVPYGRLSCRSCGSLLASVASGARRGVLLRPMASEEPAQPTAQPAAEPVVEPAPEAAPEPPDSSPVGAPGDLDDAAEPPPPDLAATRHARRWPPVLEDRPAALPTPAAQPGSTQHPDSAPKDDGPVSPAGAWVPPSVPPFPARRTVATDATGAASTDPGPRPVVRAPVDVSGWLVAVGSAMAVAGFLLPWSDALPLARGAGWTARWGLAVPSHGLLVAVAFAALALSLVSEARGAWLRTGVLALVLGGVLLGVTWPYVLGGLGADVGAIIVAVAGLILLAGGIAGLTASRHGSPEPGV